MNHTPTPWKLHEGQDYISFWAKEDTEDVLGEIQCSPEFVRANADFIVCAVNAHEDFVAFAKLIASWPKISLRMNIEQQDAWLEQAAQIAKKTLAKAEVKP